MEPYGKTYSDATRNDFQKNKSYAIKIAQGGVKTKKHLSQTISKTALKNAPKNSTDFRSPGKKPQTNYPVPVTPMKGTAQNSTNDLGHK